MSAVPMLWKNEKSTDLFPRLVCLNFGGGNAMEVLTSFVSLNVLELIVPRIDLLNSHRHSQLYLPLQQWWMQKCVTWIETP